MEDVFRLPKDTEITPVIMMEFLDKHKRLVKNRYEPLLNAYKSDHEILHRAAKPAY